VSTEPFECAVAKLLATLYLVIERRKSAEALLEAGDGVDDDRRAVAQKPIRHRHTRSCGAPLGIAGGCREADPRGVARVRSTRGFLPIEYLEEVLQRLPV